jgi:conjugal transfer ATP-binding protein TraC
MEFLTFRKHSSLHRKGQKTYVEESQQVSNVIPVIAYDYDTELFHLADNTIGFAIECEPLPGITQNTESNMQSLLELPWMEESNLQFFNFRSPDIRDFINDYKDLRGTYGVDGLSRKMIHERKKFLLEHTRTPLNVGSQKVKIHNARLIITYKVPCKKVPTAHFIEELQELRDQAVGILKNAHLQPVALSAGRYIRLMRTVFNWAPDSSWAIDDSESHDPNVEISGQIVDWNNPIDITHNYLTMGLNESGEPDKYVRVMSCKELPKAMYMGDMRAFVGKTDQQPTPITDNFAINTNIFFPTVATAKNAVAIKAGMATSQAFSGLVRIMPSLAEKKMHFDLLTTSLENNRPVQVATTAIMFSDTQKELNEACAHFRSSMKAEGFQFFNDSLKQWAAFQNSLPLCMDIPAVKPLAYYKIMTTEIAKVLLPIHGEWKGHYRKPHISLVARNGQLMGWTMHSTEAAHGLVSAGTGSGKSFAFSEVASSYLSTGAAMWIVDKGASYKNLCAVLDGNYITFDRNKDGSVPFSFNPFSSIVDFETEQEILYTQIRMMTFWLDKPTDMQTRVLDGATRTVWLAKGNEGSVSDVQKELEHSDQKLAHTLSMLIEPFTDSGRYGEWFQAGKPVAYKGRFNVVEMQGIEAFSEQMKALILMQMMDSIKAQMYKSDRAQVSMLVLDESWSFLKSEAISSAVEVLYREARKYNGSVTSISQTAGEWENSASAKVMISQALNKVILASDPYDVKVMEEMSFLGADPHAYRMVKSLQTVTTRNASFSEIYQKTAGGSGLGRLIVPEFNQVLYSTTGADVSFLEKCRDGGMSDVEAIEHLISERKKGRK